MKAFDYSKIAQFYDAMELDESLNRDLLKGLDSLFRQEGVSRIWDASCGTGAQAIPLAEMGYELMATDISGSMLDLARKKDSSGLVDFSEADMRSCELPDVDAVMSLYNALGHLSRQDFESLLRRLSESLSQGGLFVGDFDHRLFVESHEESIKKFFLSAEGQVDDECFRRLSRAERKSDGVYRMTDRWYLGTKIYHEASWDLQTWTVAEIGALAELYGFEIMRVCSRRLTELEGSFDAFLVVLKKV